jgi:hypothetical protein
MQCSQNFALCIDKKRLRTQHPDLLMSIEISRLNCQSMRKSDIVGVHSRDKTPSRQCEAFVESIYDSASAVWNHTQLWIACREIHNQAQRRPSGAIIDADDFKVYAGLARNALQGGPDELCIATDWHHDRY